MHPVAIKASIILINLHLSYIPHPFSHNGYLWSDTWTMVLAHEFYWQGIHDFCKQVIWYNCSSKLMLNSEQFYVTFFMKCLHCQSHRILHISNEIYKGQIYIHNELYFNYNLLIFMITCIMYSMYVTTKFIKVPIINRHFVNLVKPDVQKSIVTMSFTQLHDVGQFSYWFSTL